MKKNIMHSPSCKSTSTYDDGIAQCRNLLTKTAQTPPWIECTSKFVYHETKGYVPVKSFKFKPIVFAACMIQTFWARFKKKFNLQ